MTDYIRICPSCLQECALRSVDFGIGHYEYWGARGNDKQLAIVTDCCEVVPQKAPWFYSNNVDNCHHNGGDQGCVGCPARKLCVDALPFEVVT